LSVVLFWDFFTKKLKNIFRTHDATWWQNMTADIYLLAYDMIETFSKPSYFTLFLRRILYWIN